MWRVKFNLRSAFSKAKTLHLLGRYAGFLNIFMIHSIYYTVSPGGNKPMCVFYHTCVVKTQHLPVCYFHICVVISTHMCERAHMCGKNHTSCPRVVCGVYHTCVGKTFVLSFFETFPSHFFRMTPKNVCMGRCVVAIIAFVWLLLCCAFSNVSSKPIQSCICLTFPRDMFWNIPSDCLSKWMQNHIISCICLTFPRCVFSNVSSNCLSEKRHNHIGCICLTFLRYVFSNGLPEMRQSHIDFGFSPLCVFICVLKLRVCENAKSLGCHLFDFSTLYVFSGNGLPQRMHIASSHWLHLFDFSALCISKC